MLQTLISLMALFASVSAKAGVPAKVNIRDLRPTQFVVGYRYVEEKARQIEDMSDEDLRDYLRDHPVPIVIGPSFELYMIDHHHLARAVVESGHSRVYVSVLANWSHLGETAFWRKMKSEKLVYLTDEHGRQRDIDELPRHIEDLGDDPFRALAGEVRDEGGFVKIDQPFMEFEWAKFFRARVSVKMVRNQWRKAVRVAMKLAASEKAQNLPGFAGVGSCHSVF